MTFVYVSLYLCSPFSPPLTDPGRDGEEPSAEETNRFRARLYLFLEPGVSGRYEQKLNSCDDSER